MEYKPSYPDFERDPNYAVECPYSEGSSCILPCAMQTKCFPNLESKVEESEIEKE